MADLLLVLGALLLAGALDPATHDRVRVWLDRRREDRRALSIPPVVHETRAEELARGSAWRAAHDAGEELEPFMMRGSVAWSQVRPQGWGPAEGESVHGFNVRQRHAAELQGDPPPPPYPRDQHGG